MFWLHLYALPPHHRDFTDLSMTPSHTIIPHRLHVGDCTDVVGRGGSGCGVRDQNIRYVTLCEGLPKYPAVRSRCETLLMNVE